LVYGFMDLMKSPAATEGATLGTISRQLKGFAFIMLSQVTLVLGMAICAGGLQSGLGALQRAYP
jgi:hypothetical protein